MKQEQVLEEISKLDTGSEVLPRYFLGLLSSAALICSSLELEFIERLDGMRRYMTLREIWCDASVAVLYLLFITLCFWVCLLLVTEVLRKRLRDSSKSGRIFWYSALVIPLIYFTFSFVNALRLRFSPQWQPSPIEMAIFSLIAIICIVRSVYKVRVVKLQDFCRTRLAPLGWLHFVIALLAISTIFIHGLNRFRDYVNPATRVASGNLPDVYLITVDAFAAEDLSLYGYSRRTSPNLEKLSQNSYTFDYFFANSNFTNPSSTVIETGKLPWTNRVFSQGGFLRGAAQRQTLAALLQQRGYYTADLTTNYFASAFHHRTQQSYDEVGFQKSSNLTGAWIELTNLKDFNTGYTLSGPLLKALTILRRYADCFSWENGGSSNDKMVFESARQLLQRQDILQPKFVWMHILPPHDPYLPPRPFRGSFLSSDVLTHGYNFLGLGTRVLPGGVTVNDLRSRYDENVLYADHLVGDFLEWLKSTGRFDNALIIVSADHGESFEHGWFTHGGPYLYNSLIRIPMLIHLPGQMQSVRIEQAAQQADLLPTILDLLGGNPPLWADGISLKPLLLGNVLPQRTMYSMTLDDDSFFAPITHGTIAAIDDNYKYVHRLDTDETFLFRYRVDSQEKENLVKSEVAKAAQMKVELSDKLHEINERPIPQS